MKEREENKIDPNLNIPSEANTQKHINFLDVEEESEGRTSKQRDDFSEERQKQWKEGIAKGKEEREKD